MRASVCVCVCVRVRARTPTSRGIFVVCFVSCCLFSVVGGGDGDGFSRGVGGRGGILAKDGRKSTQHKTKTRGSSEGKDESTEGCQGNRKEPFGTNQKTPWGKMMKRERTDVLTKKKRHSFRAWVCVFYTAFFQKKENQVYI